MNVRNDFINTIGERLAWQGGNNPNLIQNHYYAVLAPHGATVRWTYTVPANTNILIQSLQASVIRLTVAAPVAQDFSYFEVNKGGVGAWTSLLTAFIGSNGVNDRADIIHTGPILLTAADQIRFQTLGGSTGGTLAHYGTMLGTEFDA